MWRNVVIVLIISFLIAVLIALFGYSESFYEWNVATLAPLITAIVHWWL